MKKICISFIVLFLVGGVLLFGCSNSATQTKNIEDGNIAGSKQEITNSKSLDSKLKENELLNITNGKSAVNEKAISNSFSKNNDKIINLFKNEKGQYNNELNKLYLEINEKQNSNAKIDINGFLWVNEIDGNNETYRVYVSENYYNEYTCVNNTKYTGKVKINANDTYETEWDKDIFEKVKSIFNTTVDKYDFFVDGGIINNIPKIEKVTATSRENEIRNAIKSLKDRTLSREEEFIRFTKLNNIFVKLCSNDPKVDWTYLELSNSFRNKYETKQDKSILNCFNFKANYFPYFEVINDNIVTFMAHNEYNIALEGCDYRFYITFTYDNIGNIDDIIDIKVLTEFAPQNANFNYINGSSEYGLRLLSGYINYSDSGIYNYSNTYTSDKFWKSYIPDKGILNIDVSNIYDNNYGDENYSDRAISIDEYDSNKKCAQLYVKMNNGNEHKFFVKWRTKEYDLLDEIEVIDLNAIREYKDGKFYVNGTEQHNEWVYYNGYWYYCDKDGNPITNKWIDGKYLDVDGKKVVSNKTPDGKYVDEMGYVIEDLSYDLVSSAREKDILSDAWYKTRSGLWYYFENDRTTTKKGWFTDSRDSQTYYLEPDTGIMQVGYVNINGETYYFNESTDNEPNWYEVGDGIYESYGKKVKAYGSMFRDEETPDGKKVDIDGKLIK